MEMGFVLILAICKFFKDGLRAAFFGTPAGKSKIKSFRVIHFDWARLFNEKRMMYTKLVTKWTPYGPEEEEEKVSFKVMHLTSPVPTP